MFQHYILLIWKFIRDRVDKWLSSSHIVFRENATQLTDTLLLACFASRKDLFPVIELFQLKVWVGGLPVNSPKVHIHNTFLDFRAL
jgi:hypothetical protein